MSDEIRENDVEGAVDKEQFWQAHVSAWDGSGMSQAEYCRREGLNVRIFNYWKRKLSKTHAFPSGVSLIPVRVRSFATSAVLGSHGFSPSLRVVLNNSISIEVSDGFRPETLLRLMKVLGLRV